MIKNGNDLEKFEFDGRSKVLLTEHRSRIVLLELRKPKEKHIFLEIQDISIFWDTHFWNIHFLRWRGPEYDLYSLSQNEFFENFSKFQNSRKENSRLFTND